MASAASLTVRILADISDFEKNLSKADRAMLKAADSMTAAGKKLTLGVTLPFIALSGALAKAAAEDEASISKLQRTFGGSAQAMESWIQQLMKTVPATDDELRGLAVGTDTLLRSMGLAAPAAQRMTQTVTQLAGDLAAYNHVELSVAQGALEKALSGKTRGLQEFGIVINEADIKTRAYALGIAKYGAELTHAQTTQASWSLILEKTKLQQGESARTIGEAANAMKVLRQSADSAADSFGAVVLPTVARVVGAFSDMLKGLAEMPPAFKSALVGAVALAATIGPLALGIGGLTRAVVVLRGALALFGAGSWVAGLATLGPLLVVAAIAAAGLAYDAKKAGERAAEAATNTERYAAAVDKLTVAQLKQQSAATRSAIDGLASQKAALLLQQSTKAPNGGFDNVLAGAQARQTVGIDQQIKAIDAQMASLKPGMDAIAARFIAMGAAAADTSGEAKSFGDRLKDIEGDSAAVVQSIEQMKKGWDPIVGLGRAYEDTLTRVMALIRQIPNAMDPVAVKAREIALALRGAIDPTSLANLPGVAVTRSIPNGLAGITGPTAAKLPELARPLTELEQATREGFANVSVAIGQTLAQSLAARIGGLSQGSQIGAGIGGAGGSGFLSSLLSFGGKGAFAAAGNAIVPIVGGIAGSLLGSAIGGLFGHADRTTNSLDNLGQAAQKVAESLSNIPTGYKNALQRNRFAAEDPASVGAPPTRTPKPLENVTIQNVHVYGVTDLPSLLEKLETEVVRRGNRGGFTLALGGA